MSGLEARGQIQSAGYFPSVGKEVLSALVHLIGITIISGMLSRKLDWVTRRPYWPRLLVVFNLADSWAFIFTIAILVHGLGMELSITVCIMGILSCIIFYGTSKIFIYLLLAEKVYAVWATGPVKGRLHCKVYLACMAFISSYVGVVVVMIFERIAVSDERGTCYIGLRRVSSVLLLSYDVVVNVLLTSLFVWPLLRKKLTPALRQIAIRNLWAAGVSLSTSSVNTIVLTLMNGRQLAWVCLASCGIDVVINAMALTWVTSDFSSATEDDPKPFSDTLTGSAAICSVDMDAVPDFSTSPTESINTSHIPLSCFSGAPVDVISLPYARSPRDSACARMSPSLLPESMLHPYLYPTDAEESGECLGKGKGRDRSPEEGGAKHICSLACSPSSLASPPSVGLPLPPRWRRRGRSPVSRRDPHTEIMMSELGMGPSMRDDGQTFDHNTLRASSSETRTWLYA
ncbi:hypothetical protein GSI_01497 [Ganoderma sinense ZZ0214-1]|uniref:Uncharacterized protein n=1 Tax=Ganoderma sinense ZZ0214-1 TaxID=1077348 RepID=A0A2G8SPY6_9APHY|nr:hypothetical protein GSI_01497 [Ganoderma sinense ZZ0214-1]